MGEPSAPLKYYIEKKHLTFEGETRFRCGSSAPGFWFLVELDLVKNIEPSRTHYGVLYLTVHFVYTPIWNKTIFKIVSLKYLFIHVKFFTLNFKYL